MRKKLMNSIQVETKDALLHAINEEFVEAVEVLLEHEETIHHEGTPHVSRSNIVFELLNKGYESETPTSQLNSGSFKI